MGQLSRKTVMGAPLEKVWGIWNKVEDTPSWVEGVQASEVTGKVKEGKGLEWKEKCFFANFPVEMRHTVKDWQIHENIVVEATLPMGARTQRKILFSRVSGGTEVRVDLEWDLGMAGGFISPEAAEEIMAESLDKTLSNWKQRAES